MEDPIAELCGNGLLPKLPFQLEEKEEAELTNAFINPKDFFASYQLCSVPISKQERKDILTSLCEKVSQDLDSNWWEHLRPKCRTDILLFLGESSSGRDVSWSDVDCSNLRDEIGSRLNLGLKGSQGVEQWFEKNFQDSLTPNETDFFVILQSVKEKLSKSNWKYFPACVHAFGWIIQRVKSPMLENFLEFVIPPSLLFSDDHYDDFKLIGLKCLSHIVKNAGKSDLIRNNWANVIYDAVKRHLTDKDPVVIHLMMQILFKTLKIMETNATPNCAEFTEYDRLLKTILFQIEMCSEISLKLVWLPILDTYIGIIGLASLHWSDKICHLLRACTVCNNSQIWSKLLDVTKTLIRSTWVKVDFERISEVIVRVIFNVSSFQSVCVSDQDRTEILQKSLECLDLLKKCDGFSEIATELTQLQDEKLTGNLRPEFVQFFKQIGL